MKVSCKELRERAWTALENNWWAAAAMMLVYMLISIGLEVSVWLSWLTLLLLPMGYAISITMLRVARKEATPDVKNLFTVYRDNFTQSFVIMLLVALFVCLWALLLIIPGIIMAYAYSMSLFILNDNPELKPIDAIRKSKELMRGHKWDLFVLDLTFLGWILLSCLTGGILFLFVSPYIETAHAEFYLDLIADTQTEEIEAEEIKE